MPRGKDMNLFPPRFSLDDSMLRQKVVRYYVVRLVHAQFEIRYYYLHCNGISMVLDRLTWEMTSFTVLPDGGGWE